MNTIKVFFDRVSTMSFKRMFMMIRQIHKEHGKNPLFVFIDMVVCALKDNIGYQDYRVFGFAKIPYKNRKTFLNMNKNLELVNKVNSKKAYPVYRDKTLFFIRFKDFIKRDWINLNECTKEEFTAFCKNKESIFAKVPCSFGGQGIGEVRITSYTNFKSLYDTLIESGQTLIEEKIVQHEKMKALHPESLNTLRIVTLKNNGEINILYSLLRMGQQGSVIDNVTSGGIYAPVDENGIITHPAFCDKTGEILYTHPTTKHFIPGFKIPYYKEAIELVKAIATAETDMNYIGWDIAITPSGPVIVEGNNVPIYEIMQNYAHRDDDIGLIPKIEKILGEKLKNY